MYSRQVVPSGLRRLALEQAGVVTREQAIGHGLGLSAVRRLNGEGWTRLARGVYLTSTPPAGWLSLAWAGVLIGGDAARLGGLAAACLHGLVEAQPPQILVLIPAECSTPRVAGPWYFRRERSGARLLATVGGRRSVWGGVPAGREPRPSWLARPLEALRQVPQRRLNHLAW
jgi:predicted transcriptional regulator of viral defense system